MKRWWIIFDGTSKSDEYHQIIKFIVQTFIIKKIPFEMISNDNLTSEKLHFLLMHNALPDISLFWCSGNYENKQLMSKLGVLVLNGYDESLICEDKYLQLKTLSNEVDVIPHTIFADTNSIYDILSSNVLSYPIIVKFAQSTLGNGVFVANSVDDIQLILSNISKDNMYIMLQDYLEFASKKVTKVCFFNNVILSSYTQIESKCKLQFIQHFITDMEKHLIFKTMSALKLKFGSIDIIYQSPLKPLICEINNLPNILKTNKVTKVNVIEKIIDFYS